MNSTLEKSLARLSEAPPVETYLTACKEESADGSVPEILILFPRFREDEPDVRTLAEFLWLQAVNYVIPVRLRRRVYEEMKSSPSGADLASAARLVQRTKRAFIEFNAKNPYRASEVGELLAYLLALHHLGAVQLASKMALKTNSNMPVHGLDGIHARFSDGVMTLFFLESKLAGSADSGVLKYAESVAGFGSNRKQYLLEYDIIGDLSNLTSLPEEERQLALTYLDVYGTEKANRLERSVGIICYSDSALYSQKLPKTDNTPPAAHEAALAARLSKQYGAHRDLVGIALSKHGVDHAVCKVFLIAFPDVDLLRKTFYEVMNG